MNAEQIGMFDGSKRYQIRKPIRLIELFAGIGSQAKALQNIGADFEHYRICEFDKYAVQSYNAVHGTQFETSDITKINASDLGITDTDKYEYIMTYSFPCTDLSKAGQQKGMAKGSGTRSGLLWEVERLLDECSDLPQVLLMENVPDVIGTKNISHFANWIKKLETLGYHNYWKLLNAKDYGIPQNRNRCFMVSVLGDYYYDFPKEIPLKLRLKDMLESKVDEKYYLSEKVIKGLNTHLERNKEKGNGFGWKPKDGNDIATTIKTEAGYRPASNFIKEPCCEQVAQLDGFESSGRIYSENGLCPTINTLTSVQKDNIVLEPPPILWQSKNDVGYKFAYDGDGLILQRPWAVGSTVMSQCANTIRAQNPSDCGVYSNYRIRKLTPKECWRLMGFNDEDFYNASNAGVSNSQLYKQAGNSIVVKVLEVIFKQMTAKVEEKA